MINYDKLGQSVTTTGGIEKVKLTASSFFSYLNPVYQTFALQLQLEQGSLGYIRVNKNITSNVTEMDPPVYFADPDDSLANPPSVPVISMNPFIHDLYINTEPGTRFSISV